MRRFFFAFCLIFIFAFTSIAQETPVTPTLIAQYGRGEVKSVAWSPDGQSVWVGTSEGTWQLDSALNEIRAFPDIRYGALSPDGKWLAGYDSEGKAFIYDTLNGYESYALDNFGASISNRSPLWSANSRRVAFQRPKWVQIANVEALDNPDGLSGEFILLAWSQMGDLLAGFDGTDVWLDDPAEAWDWDIRLPHTRNLQLNYANSLSWRGDTEIYWSALGDGGDDKGWTYTAGTPSESSEEIRCSLCRFSPDGRYGATVHYGFLTPLTVWDFESETLVLEKPLIIPHTDQPFQIGNPVWKPNSYHLLFAIETREDDLTYLVQMLDALTGEMIWETTGLQQWISDFYWNPEGSQVIGLSEGLLTLFDGETGEILARNQDFAHIQLVDLDTHGGRIAWADGAGNVVSGDMLSGDINNEFMIWSSIGYVHKLAWQPEGDFLVVSESRYDHLPTQITRLKWGEGVSIDAKPLFFLSGYFWGVGDNFMDSSWSPDGTKLAIVDSTSAYWLTEDDLEKFYSTPEPSYIGDKYRIIDLIWLSNMPNAPWVHIMYCCHTYGSLMYTGEHESQPITIDVGLSDLARMTLTTPTKRAAYSPQRRYMFAVDENGDGFIWHSDERVFQFLADTEQVVWSPDDSQMAIVRGDGSLWLIDEHGAITKIWTPSLIVTELPEAYLNGVYEQDWKPSVYWSGDGTTLAYRYGGVVRVWKMQS